MRADDDDTVLAQAAAGGDRTAFAQLLERHYERIHRIGWRMLGDPSEAEDLAQDVCATLGRKIGSFRGEALFATWLYRLVINAARDRMRARGRRLALGEAWAEADALARAGDAARKAEAAWLREALGALTPELRETAVLVLDEGLDHASAGAALGISGGTVSWRMSEVRKRLRAVAASEGGIGQETAP